MTRIHGNQLLIMLSMVVFVLIVTFQLKSLSIESRIQSYLANSSSRVLFNYVLESLDDKIESDTFSIENDQSEEVDADPVLRVDNNEEEKEIVEENDFEINHSSSPSQPNHQSSTTISTGMVSTTSPPLSELTPVKKRSRKSLWKKYRRSKSNEKKNEKKNSNDKVNPKDNSTDIQNDNHNDNDNHNNNQLNNHTNNPTQPTPTNSSQSTKDPRLSRFGKRFRLSNHAAMMRKYEGENSTYFPKDHVSDGHLYNLRVVLLEEEKNMLELQYPFFAPFLPHYEDFSMYLATRYIFFKQYWSNEEKETFGKLNAERRERYRHHLLKKYEDYSVADEKKRIAERQSLFKQFRHYSNGKCEGCRYLDTADYPLENHYYGIVRKFKGNKEVFTIYNNTFYQYPSPDTPFSITGICVTTLDRLSLLPQLLYRWEGPLVLVINGGASREGEMITYINSHYIPTRVTIILYLMDTRLRGVFPVNLLRNLAIRNIETTHYQILDMDLLPTVNTYSEMMKLPEPLQEGKRAVILPVFFFDRKAMLTRCSDLNSCTLLSAEVIPHNKTELEACLYSKVCISSKPGIRTHVYVMPEWYDNTTSVLSRVRCFTADFQEPYVLLRYQESTPLFDERFVNYGYNKVQLFEHLRSAGFTFYIWNHCFAMDLPHPDSTLRKAYIDGIKGETSDMRELYKDFQAELNEKYRTVNPSRICFSLQKRYFNEVKM